MSRRRKLTPEIIAKTLSLTVFTAAVAYASYNLIDLFRSRSVFASESPLVMPRTLSDVPEDSHSATPSIYKPNGPTYPFIRNNYRTIIISNEVVETPKETEEVEEVEEIEAEEVTEESSVVLLSD